MSIQSEITRIVGEVSEQSDLINEITTILQGKTIGGGGGGTIESGVFSFTSDMYEPGVNEYVLTSNALKISSRNLILVGCTTPDGLDSICCIFRRNNTSGEFTRYDGDMSVFVTTHTAGRNRIENDSTVVLYGGPNSSRIIDTMYFITV